MPREQFHQELQQLQEELLVMSSMVGKAIERSVLALRTRDLKLAQDVVSDDQKINQQRFGIEENCLLLIATQQPMASGRKDFSSSVSAPCRFDNLFLC